MLERYAQCKNSEEVLAAQSEFMSHLSSKNNTSTYDDIYAGLPSESEGEEEASQEEEEEEEEKDNSEP